MQEEKSALQFPKMKFTFGSFCGALINYTVFQLQIDTTRILHLVIFFSVNSLCVVKRSENFLY